MISPDGCCKTHANQGDPCWTDAYQSSAPEDTTWMANQASYNGQQPLGGVYAQSNPMPYRQAVMNPAPVQHSSMPAPPIQRESSLYADPRTVDVNKSDDPALAAPANFAYPPAYGPCMAALQREVTPILVIRQQNHTSVVKAQPEIRNQWASKSVSYSCNQLFECWSSLRSVLRATHCYPVIFCWDFPILVAQIKQQKGPLLK
jgi:hypothetical protein